MTETSLLQDFIVETAEHLDEMEANLLRLEDENGRRARLDDIFRAAHTIKGAAEYLGLTRMAELSHRLENLLDLLRQNARDVDRPMMDLLMACRDRLAGLTGELEQSQQEQTGIEDLLHRIQALQSEQPPSVPASQPEAPSTAGSDEVYAEESDPELFAIFKAQLAEGLAALQDRCGRLTTARSGHRDGLLAECLALIDPLRASANYMGYDGLTARYDAWRDALQAARTRLAAGNGDFLQTFAADVVQTHLVPIAARFPDLALPWAPAPLTPDPAAGPDLAPAREMAAVRDPAPGTAAAKPPAAEDDLFEQLSRSFDLRRQRQAPTSTPVAVDPLANELFSDPAGDAPVPDDRPEPPSAIGPEIDGWDDTDMDLTAAYAAAPATAAVPASPPSPPSASSAAAVQDPLRGRNEALESNAIPPAAEEADGSLTAVEAASEDAATYVEENDSELFEIFQDHLKKGLAALQRLTEQLRQSPCEPMPLIDEGLRLLDALRSSANYMDYHHLTDRYDKSREALQAARASLIEGDGGFQREVLAQALQAHMDAVTAHFPDLDLSAAAHPTAATGSDEAGLPTTSTAPEAPAAAPWAPLPDRPEASPANGAAPIPDPAAREEIYAEETDQELFQIFKDQLVEGLSALQACTAALSAEPTGAVATLNQCLTLIDPLRSSANYMGYERLTARYDAWRQELEATRECLRQGDADCLKDFAARVMPEFIAAVAARFPEIELPSTAVAEAPDAAAAAAEAPPAVETPADEAAPMEISDQTRALDNLQAPADTSLLQDFITETGEHLEEMEASLLRLEADHGRRETLDDIFRAAHTIKGAAEYLGMTRMAELSHRLENLLDLLRQNARPVDRPMIDLLMACRDRLAGLAGELAQSQIEQSAIDDLIGRINSMQQTPSSPAEGSDATPAAETPDFAEETAQAAVQAFFDTPTEDRPADVAAPVAPPEAAASDEDLWQAPGDRRDPAQSGRRRSDRTGERLIKQSIRVDAGKIDALMNQVGELVVSRAWFAQLFSEMRELQQSLKQSHRLEAREMKQVKGLTFRLSEATVALGRVANELQEGVMKVRMLPIAQLFNRYPRLVYDLVRDSGKEVNLDIRGEDTELDKMVIEAISDPLIHIIRNAVDHGIETAAERRQHGKPTVGTIRLEAYHEGNHVVIEITDDGRGLDLARIRAKALAGGFASHDELERIGDKEAVQFIMQPGFSTAEKVTHTSGRGVGMDVVKKNIEKLNGTIEIDTVPGVETRLRIKIPLTLAIIPALLVKVRGELFTIPLSTVEETLRIFPEDIATIEGMEVLQLRENTLPLVRLPELFNLTGSAPNARRTFVVVVSTGLKRVGLVVDELLGQEEVVIKPLEDYVQERSGFSGATILGDGRISLILDVYELVNLSIAREARRKKRQMSA